MTTPDETTLADKFERVPINKLVGRYTNGPCECFLFVDELFSQSSPRGRFYSVATTELVGVTPEAHAWQTETDEGLLERFSDYDETEGKTDAEIIAWGKQEIAVAVEADGDCFGRVYDDSYRETYWPQLRARGFGEEQFVAFDCMGSGWLNHLTEVYEPEVLAQAQAWLGCATP